jgi:octaprenyl-diphosphate synthase
MLRPMLVIVSGMATSADGQTVNDRQRSIATVVEMVHMATLVHDDILDEARVRRRGVTINQLQGNETAVMLGDYLISHAYHLCSVVASAPAARLIAIATNTVCEGELLQLANRNNLELDEGTYFEIIRRKTASLCGTCCELGAVLSEEPTAALRGTSLNEFGIHLGMAFQIIDDVLDLVGSEQTVGKTLGRDLGKGKLTLPLIHGLSSGPASARQELQQILRGPIDESDHRAAARVRDILLSCGSVDYANDAARRAVTRAKAALLTLPASAARGLLAELADNVLTRQS